MDVWKQYSSRRVSKKTHPDFCCALQAYTFTELRYAFCKLCRPCARSRSQTFVFILRKRVPARVVRHAGGGGARQALVESGLGLVVVGEWGKLVDRSGELCSPVQRLFEVVQSISAIMGSTVAIRIWLLDRVWNDNCCFLG